MAASRTDASPTAVNAERPDVRRDVPRDRKGRPLIDPDPNRPGAERALLAGTGIPVWAVIAHLQALTGADIDDAIAVEAKRQAATDYRIDEGLVSAAVAYYRLHRHAIDARLARNAAAVS